MQPTYLPWVGYFDLMDQVDQFVLLDDVQFVKRSWQQRNRLKTPKGLEWLTIPVLHTGRREQTISEVELLDPSFWKKHLRGVELNYGAAPYFEEYLPGLRSCYEETAPGMRLAGVTGRFITWLAGQLRIRTPIVWSSQLSVHGVRSERLVRICQALGADTYLSPPGSAEYLLGDLPLFREAGVAVFFHHYDPHEYRQLFPPFLACASAIDLLFNEGPRSLEVIRSGRRPAFTPEELPAAPSTSVQVPDSP
jgi:hypothetical protein